MTRKLLSIVVPVYQEYKVLEPFIALLLPQLAGVDMDVEILLVDDGSTDDSYALIARLHQQDERIKGMRFTRNFGKESALLAGLTYAHGDAVVTIDADLQHPPGLIPSMISQWQAGFAIVHGVKQEPKFGRGYAKVFNRFFSYLAGFDMQGASDFKLLDRSVVNQLVQRFPERRRYYRGLSRWMGYPQVELTFQVQARAAGESHWGMWQLLRYGWDALTSFSSLPLKLVPMLGVVMLVISLALGGEALWSRLTGESVSGFATLEMTILLTGSLVMIGLGIIGQYLARIYEELKRRPSFLIQERVGIDALETDQDRRF